MTISTPVAPSATSAVAPPAASDALPIWWPIAQQLSHVQPLQREQCLHLLPPAGRGWVFYPQQLQEHRVPARYRVQEASLLITPEPSAALAAAPLVLFRVEHLDPEQRFGWTIGVAGPLQPGGPTPAAEGGDDQSALVLGLANLAGRFVVSRTAAVPLPAELDLLSSRQREQRLR